MPKGLRRGLDEAVSGRQHTRRALGTARWMADARDKSPVPWVSAAGTEHVAVGSLTLCGRRVDREGRDTWRVRRCRKCLARVWRDAGRVGRGAVRKTEAGIDMTREWFEVVVAGQVRRMLRKLLRQGRMHEYREFVREHPGMGLPRDESRGLTPGR